VLSFKSGAVALGVYASLGGCVTGSSGTCSVPVTIERGAAAANYTITALAGSLSNSAGLTVTSAPGAITAGSVSVTQGGSNTVSIGVYDGTGSPMASQTVSISGAPTGLSVSLIGSTNSSGIVSATVSATGAVSSGIYSLLLTDGTASAIMPVTVTGVPAVISSPAVSGCKTCSIPVVVTVRDSSGSPVVGQSVTFSSNQSGLGVTGSVTTNASGMATAYVTVGTGVATGTYNGAITVRAGSKSATLSVSVTP